MKEILIANIDLIHTTKLGIERIQKNIKIDGDVIKFLKNKILKNDSIIYRKGKNYYCEVDDIKITINSFNFCIITAQYVDKRKC